MKLGHRAWRAQPWIAVFPGLLILSAIAIGFVVSSKMTDNRLGVVFTFISVLATAAVSLVAVLLKDVADKRIEKDKAIAESRLKEEKKQEGERLRLDAAMRAGALLAHPDDGPATPASMASGLLALTQLDQCELAVALLVDLWSETDPEERDGTEPTPRGSQISTETAILTISAALQSNEPNAPLVAAELLCQNAWRLDACRSLHWPCAVDGRWRADVGQKTKLLLVDALVKMTITSAPNENALRSLAVRLYGIWAGDNDINVKSCIANLIDAIIGQLETCQYKNFVEGPQTVPLSELQRAAQDKADKQDHYLNFLMMQRSAKLKSWAQQCGNTFSLHCGALADGAAQVHNEIALRSAL